MKSLKSDNYIWALLLTAFFISGFLHVLLYGVPYTDSIVQIFGGTVILCWMAAILRRIVDKKLRLFMAIIAALMLGYFAVQMCKYKIFTEDEMAFHYAWYCFYIPMSLIPLHLFYVALFMNRPECSKINKKWFLLYVPAVFLITGILTNDFHFLAFRSLDGVSGVMGYVGTYTYGPLYYLMIAWETLLVLISVFIIFRKCGTAVAKQAIWLPAGTLLGGSFLMLLGVFGLFPKIAGVTVWQLTEIYVYTFTLFLEGCIQIGMIPANTGYEKTFGILHTPVVIYDTKGRGRVVSASTIPEVTDGEQVKIETMNIYGGSVSWAVNLKEINSLNRQIMEVTSQIESRNARLLSENQMKEEQISLNARNMLYDQIADIVKPQLSQIEALLEEQIHMDFDTTIAKINVLNAYIKRRSNMELLKADTGRLPVSELIMAIRESMEYLKDTGVACSVSALSRDELPAEQVIRAYELFEHVLETCLGTAKMTAVFLTCKDQTLRIRLMTELKENYRASKRIPVLSETFQDPAAEFWGSVQEEYQEYERIVTIVLQEGGAV